MPCRSVPFKKMYGLGNDFIVLDARKDPSVRASQPPPLCVGSPAVRACLTRRTLPRCRRRRSPSVPPP